MVRRESAYASTASGSTLASPPVYETIDDAAVAVGAGDERIYAQLENLCDNCECETSSPSPELWEQSVSSRSEARPQSMMSNLSSPRRISQDPGRLSGRSLKHSGRIIMSPGRAVSSQGRALTSPGAIVSLGRSSARTRPEATTSSNEGSEDVYSGQYSEPVNIVNPSSRTIQLPAQSPNSRTTQLHDRMEAQQPKIRTLHYQGGGRQTQLPSSRIVHLKTDPENLAQVYMRKRELETKNCPHSQSIGRAKQIS